MGRPTQIYVKNFITRKLQRKYRDVTWSLELSVQQLKKQFQVEYGTDIEEFLGIVYLGGTELEHHAQCIEFSLAGSAVELLRTRRKNGETYYGCCITFLSPQQLSDVNEILEQLRPHIRDISRTTYYWKHERAVEALSSVLWGYTSKEFLDELLPLRSDGE